MARTGSISITTTSQNTSNLTSAITITGTITTTGDSYRGDHRTGTVTVTQGGTTIHTSSFTSGAPENSTTTLFTINLTVNHNSDGTSGTIVASYNYDSGWCTASQSTTLNPFYFIKYNANGGSGVPSAQTKKHGTNLTLSSTKPTRTGYAFLGWNSSSAATSSQYNAGGTYSNNSSTTLYAVWKPNVLTVNYYSNYADYCTFEGNPVSVNSSSNVLVTTEFFDYNQKYEYGLANVQNTGFLYLSRTGYTPTGYWGTTTSGGTLVDQMTSFSTGQALAEALGKDLSSGSVSINVYAQWDENYLTVNYYSNYATSYGGTYDAENIVDNNNVLVYTRTYYYDNDYENGLLNYKEIDSSIYMFRTGYTATGDWGTSTDGGTLISQSDNTLNTGKKIADAFGKDLTSGNASVNVYAQWNVNQLIVNYYSNYATAYEGAELIDTTVSNNNVYLCTRKYDYDASYSNGLLNYADEGEALYMYRTGYFATENWGTEPDGGNLVHQSNSYDTGQKLAIALGTSIENGDVTISVYPQWEPANVAYYNNDGTYVLCNTYGKVDGSWQPMLFYGKIAGDWKRSIIEE